MGYDLCPRGWYFAATLGYRLRENRRKREGEEQDIYRYPCKDGEQEGEERKIKMMIRETERWGRFRRDRWEKGRKDG